LRDIEEVDEVAEIAEKFGAPLPREFSAHVRSKVEEEKGSRYDEYEPPPSDEDDDEGDLAAQQEEARETFVRWVRESE
jgi:hypothetical protein